MSTFTLEEMYGMQRKLQERYEDKWGSLSPDVARSQLLWMMGEIGEVIDIMKKKKDSIMDDEEVRSHFIEEMADVLMYYIDVLLCYNISPADLKKAYTRKYEFNMDRWE